MKEQAGQSLSFKVPSDRGCLIGDPFKRPKQKSIAEPMTTSFAIGCNAVTHKIFLGDLSLLLGSFD